MLISIIRSNIFSLFLAIDYLQPNVKQERTIDLEFPPVFLFKKDMVHGFVFWCSAYFENFKGNCFR